MLGGDVGVSAAAQITAETNADNSQRSEYILRSNLRLDRTLLRWIERLQQFSRPTLLAIAGW